MSHCPLTSVSNQSNTTVTIGTTANKIIDVAAAELGPVIGLVAVARAAAVTVTVFFLNMLRKYKHLARGNNCPP